MAANGQLLSGSGGTPHRAIHLGPLKPRLAKMWRPRILGASAYGAHGLDWFGGRPTEGLDFELLRSMCWLQNKTKNYKISQNMLFFLLFSFKRQGRNLAVEVLSASFCVTRRFLRWSWSWACWPLAREEAEQDRIGFQ